MRRLLPLALLAVATSASAAKVTTPEQQFGHPIGADYVLPNYVELTAYWRKLAKESDRMRLTTIGKTEEGRDQLMAIVSSPENLKKLDRYRTISERLAHAKGVTEAEARALAAEGKTIVWIDGGLHANEVLGAQQLMETLYQVLSRDDAETKAILDNCIVLFVHCNPDGMDFISDWYMREKDPMKRRSTGFPRLYQKYIGHDDNRDSFMATQKETVNMNRVMYREWFPQSVYNHHQTGPRGAVMFCPPYRKPFNHNVDPLATAETDFVGMAIHDRLLAEGKGGAVREAASYSSWWNGGVRTTAYFHNMVGILTETIGNPTPYEVPFVPEKQISDGDILLPVKPGLWHFRQSIDYSVSANYAVMSLAAQKRPEFLFNIWRMGMNSVERGSRDNWTVRPKMIEGKDAEVEARLKDPALRDPRAYVLPADQKDFPTAVKFANTLIKCGVAVERATAAFSANGKKYPAGSLVVRCDQAFRPHVLDMFEPQDHPNDVPAPGAAPTPPYDVAGWTLALQMGVAFDRVLEKLDAPTEAVPDEMKPPPGRTEHSSVGWFVSKRQLDSYALVQRLLNAGSRVANLGSVYFVAKFDQAEKGKPERPDPNVESVLAKGAIELGVNASSTDQYSSKAIKPQRIGLWDKYGGSIESGWIRWIFDQYGIPYRLVFAKELDAGDLKSKFDVLIFPEGASFARPASANAEARVPDEFAAMAGTISPKTVPAIRDFMEKGGSVVAIGTATNLAYGLDLPVGNALVDADGAPLKRAKYYVPGSLLEAKVDPTQPIAAGMPERAIFDFDNSPVFRFKPDAEAKGLKRVAWFDTNAPLRSGWAWGQGVLKDGIVGFTAPVGKGTLYAFGPEITFRAQSHGTFRLLFNALYR